MIARITNMADFPQALSGGVVAIGNFDGVHRGHQAVLEQARAFAGDTMPCVALTFEPHPRAVFRPDVPLHRITPAPMKAHILAMAGMDGVVEIPFTRDFAGLSADQFINDILLSGLAAKQVVTGFDFHFGKDRKGGPAYLMQEGAKRGFGVSLVDAFRDENAEVISSSRIRDQLQAGEIIAANGLLGYRFCVGATVTKGKQLGRTLGYPTANMALADDTPMAHGIYAVRYHTPDGQARDGVASFGRRPTVDNDGAPLLETFIFDFSADLYGQPGRVSLCAFLRGEEKFDSLDALTVQMKRDEAEARAILASLKPLSALDDALTFAAPQG